MKGKKQFIYFVKPVFTQFVKTSFALMLLFFSLLSCSGNGSADKNTVAPSDSLQKNILAAGSGFIYPKDAGGKRLLFFLVS
jgi:hypothetical protein